MAKDQVIERDDSTSPREDPVKRMLEEMSYQTDQIGRVLAEMRRANCQLEQIAKRTCAAQNELHRQTALQTSMLKLLAYQAEIARAGNPGLAQLLDCKYGFDRCFEIEHCAGDDPCKHVPCPDGTRLERGKDDCKTGKVKPGRVKGAPYRPTEREDNPNKQPNTRPVRIVPDGPFRGILRRTPASPLRDIGSGNPGGSGLDFPVWTEDTSVTPASTNAADISGAKGGRVVMMSGNWWVDYSTDSGATFTTLNPTTIFPNTLVGGFCCDQIIQYAPSIDRFLWLLQYSSDATGANAYRLAAASPQDIIDSNCTAWTYWDFTSGLFGLGTDWMDYPSLALGDGEAYFSFDVLDTVTPDNTADNGLVVVRLNLAEIAAGGTLNFGFTAPANGAVAWGSGCSNNTGNEVFWAGHVDNSTMRVFSWRNDTGTYFWRDIEVRNWPNGTLTSTGPNGNNWFGWGFPSNAVIGVTRRLNEVWFAWTASNGDGGNGGFNFPHPHVQIVKVNITNYTVIEQMQVWNPDLAFGYPHLATNSDNEVGICLGWGGGGSLHANSAVGFMGDYVVWFRDGSTWTHTRWGDYVAIRQAAPESHMFAAFGYSITDTSTPTTASHRFDPYYVLFGREKNEPPPIG
jgi:hypothetical protein